MAFNLLQSTQAKRAAALGDARRSMLLAWSLLAWVAARLLIVRADLARADALVMLSGGSFTRSACGIPKPFRAGTRAEILLTDDGYKALVF